MKPVIKIPRVLTGGNLLRMAITFAIAWLYINLCSCYTKKGAIQRFCKTDTAHAEIPIDTTLSTKPAEIGFSMNCDSLKQKYDSMAAASRDTVFIPDTIIVPGKPAQIIPRKGVLIYTDTVADIYYSVKSDGSLSFKVKVKPQKVRYQDNKKVAIPITVPNNQLSIMEMLHGARWYLVVAFMVGLAFGLYLKLH